MLKSSFSSVNDLLGPLNSMVNVTVMKLRCRQTTWPKRHIVTDIKENAEIVI